MIIVYAIHYSCLHDHVFTWASDKLVATQLLKIVKLIVVEPVLAF